MTRSKNRETSHYAVFSTFRYFISSTQSLCVVYTGYTQKNGAVSRVNKKFISHPTRAQRTPSAAATLQVSHALPAVRFSCLLRDQFPRWRRSRKTLSVCSVLMCPDLWLQCSVQGLEKTHHAWCIFQPRPDRPWTPPSFLFNGYRVYLPEVKRPELGVDHAHRLAPEVKGRVELYLFSLSGL